jgi:hypothetical protein
MESLAASLAEETSIPDEEAAPKKSDKNLKKIQAKDVKKQ